MPPLMVGTLSSTVRALPTIPPGGRLFLIAMARDSVSIVGRIHSGGGISVDGRGKARMDVPKRKVVMRKVVNFIFDVISDGR